MSITEHLKSEIEATAASLDIAPSTVGERAGQGGQFYKRLCDGKRVWPETAEAVLARLADMKAKAGDAA
ncbi:hypothetical protein [Roseovarius indicus]|uniref:Uncharacterized protein n=1 Tax=Roseovarius indicus TaxID=540747 RepID=A0A0T5P890_9RHOB|nr:hypothetical protein [Roseovarius indicus]KRS17511.1 hypothetical protein XM52_13595 [Roseovarius indicus]QEW26712.1 hypothetical protein RIdsm_02514 [Roseovarius indicus]SFD61234.1 hypothetical protein SAMN04488031_101828 [Roseovarius indicus]